MSLFDELNRDIEQLRAENERDWLTGVLNRGAVEKHINDIVKQGAGTLVLLDIDDFSAINSSFGHLAGDRALQQLASILSRMVLRSDLIARIGGDEFIIFIRGEHPDSFIEERVKQINARLANESFSDIGKKTLVLSFGWAQANPSDNYESLFTRAEEHLKSRIHTKKPRTGKTLEDSLKIDGNHIRAILREPEPVSGAYYQDFENFEILYRYIERMMKRSGRNAFILLLTLSSANGSMPDYDNRAAQMKLLGNCIRSSLRISDIYTQYSSSQFLIMNIDSDIRYSEQIADRVRKAFYLGAGPDNNGLILHESYPMGMNIDNQQQKCEEE